MIRKNRLRLLAAFGLFALALTGVSYSSSSPAQADDIIAQLGEDIDGEAAGDQAGWSVSLSSDGTRVAVAAYGNDGANGIDSGHVRLYEYDSATGWQQLGSDIDGEAADDLSGYSVSLSADGTRVAIGASQNDGGGSNAGHARVYEYDTTNGWLQLGGDIDGEAAGDKSGWSVSLSSDGTRLAVGAPYNDAESKTDAGHVRIYRWDSNADQWVQMGSDIDGEVAGDLSGYSVSLDADGSRIAIGARYNGGTESDQRGHVRVYEWSGSAWSQVGSDIDGEEGYEYSGSSVEINADGSRVVVGAPQNDVGGSNAGQARIYDYDSTSGWQKLGSSITGTQAGARFGTSVSLNDAGTVVAAGAEQFGAEGLLYAGNTEIYRLNNDTWNRVGTGILGEAQDDSSGYSISLDGAGSAIAIGAYGNDQNGSASGHTRVFSISTSTTTSSTITSAENTSTPGIFLSLLTSAGSHSGGSEVRFGAYAVQGGSPYVVSIREANLLGSQRVLASGRANSGGHLDQTIVLPALSAGTHTLVFSAYSTAGAHLILGNTITVDASGVITIVSPEDLQPKIR